MTTGLAVNDPSDQLLDIAIQASLFDQSRQCVDVVKKSFSKAKNFFCVCPIKLRVAMHGVVPIKPDFFSPSGYVIRDLSIGSELLKPLFETPERVHTFSGKIKNLAAKHHAGIKPTPAEVLLSLQKNASNSLGDIFRSSSGFIPRVLVEDHQLIFIEIPAVEAVEVFSGQIVCHDNHDNHLFAVCAGHWEVGKLPRARFHCQSPAEAGHLHLAVWAVSCIKEGSHLDVPYERRVAMMVGTGIDFQGACP